jgi:ADP-ribose pyrophosphatase YjhB (NUDIX family)
MSEKFRNPLLTVDIIIELTDGSIVLIERKNPPHGWALPGGFVDYGERIERAAAREAREETSLDVTLEEQFYTYSDPARDRRHHTVSTVFIATAQGLPRAADDAKTARAVREDNLPAPLVFDHAQILRDYFMFKKTGRRPKPGNSTT